VLVKMMRCIIERCGDDLLERKENKTRSKGPKRDIHTPRLYPFSFVESLVRVCIAMGVS
jgi:hypothetical protein